MNDRKVAEILISEVRNLGERCEGYREALGDTIVEIVKLERDNLMSKTAIQQKINDQCNATGDWLANNQ